MAMTCAMEEVDYDTVDFNDVYNSEQDYDNHAASLRRHPPWMTEAHFVYHLYRGGDGRLGFVKDKGGEPVCSPRYLRNLCMFSMVTRPVSLCHLRLNAIPSDLYPGLLREAVLQRQLKAIAYLVSTWPFQVMNIQDVIPSEEMMCNDFLTVPLEKQDCMSLMDSITVGLLSLKPDAKLRTINFSGFRHDRRLCGELLRLPILWMKPIDRHAGFLHSELSKVLAIGQDTVDAYLGRISTIYSNIDLLVRHGEDLGPITVILDCMMTVDDVPIGLAIQHISPFRYRFPRAWLETLPDVCLPLSLLGEVLESKYLTHVEIEDQQVCSSPERWDYLMEGLGYLGSLQSLSLPNSIHVTQLPTATTQLAGAIKDLDSLRKLNLASCTLRDTLENLLAPPTFHLTYLNLRDCRLAEADIQALLFWPGLSELRELNLSRNNLSPLVQMISNLLPKMASITCFAISYCSLSLEDIRVIVRHCMDCLRLKVLCIQSFIPPPAHEVRGILEDCANIQTLQKCVLLPEPYAFPGNHITERQENQEKMMVLCSEILESLGRGQIELE